jgi:hypothetical protein
MGQMGVFDVECRLEKDLRPDGPEGDALNGKIVHTISRAMIGMMNFGYTSAGWFTSNEWPPV